MERNYDYIVSTFIHNYWQPQGLSHWPAYPTSPSQESVCVGGGGGKQTHITVQGCSVAPSVSLGRFGIFVKSLHRNLNAVKNC